MLLFTVATEPADAQEKMKIYISADMEGVVGVVTGENLGPSGFEYSKAREWMTAEVNAAIDGARAAGATEIVISDSHGNGQNLLIDKLPPDVTLIRSWPRPLMMMEGIDETFDAAIFIGYHSSTTNNEGVRAHTMSSGRLADIRLNGISVPEAGINAAIAGHFGVPVVMLSGDNAIVEEARALLGDIEGAVVKEAISYHSAKTLMPEVAYKLIREKVTTAIERTADFEPYELSTPVTLDVRFKNYRPSEVLAYLSIVERTDSHSIRFVGKDMIEVSKFVEFMMHYDGAQPQFNASRRRSTVKRLVQLLFEIHRRFIWQAFSIYLLVAFVAYRVSEQIAQTRGLPDWFVPVAVVLLVVGLPIILTTAIVQEGIPAIGRSDPALRVDADLWKSDPSAMGTDGRGNVWQVFTWRNAILGGVAAFTLWAMVAAGWLILAEKIVDQIQNAEQQESVVDGEH
jgi:D-amino peptidase